jgi:hypothetical protein
MSALDPETQQEVALFNPRLDRWSDHFIWSADGLRIIGVTMVGRATVSRLDMNDDGRSTPFIQMSRQIWMRMGLHPPIGDPRLTD